MPLSHSPLRPTLLLFSSFGHNPVSELLGFPTFNDPLKLYFSHLTPMLSQLHLAVSSSNILKFKHFSAGKAHWPSRRHATFKLGLLQSERLLSASGERRSGWCQAAYKAQGSPHGKQSAPIPDDIKGAKAGSHCFGVGFTLLPHVMWPHPHEGHSILNPLDTAHISIYSLESLFSGCLGDRTLVFSTAILGAPPSPCLVPSAASFRAQLEVQTQGHYFWSS